MKADCLVTGGAGFIGSNIVRGLVEKGRSVRVLDNLATGSLENLRDLLDRADFIEGDIRKMSVARKAARGVRHVFHLAALPSVAQSVEDPVTSNEVNATGTLNMLVAARDAGADRFVFSSSSAIYGNDPALPKREDMLPEPLSPYAVQKAVGEHYCRIFHGLYGLKTFALRYFNVFGPRQNPKSQYAAVVPNFVDALKHGKSPTIHGDGGQTRDFIFVEDVVRANLACGEADEKAAGQVYNVAWGKSITVKELADLLIRVTGRNVAPVHTEARQGDVRHSRADTSRARDLLRWTPTIPFEEGLRRTVEWFMTRPG